MAMAIFSPRSPLLLFPLLFLSLLLHPSAAAKCHPDDESGLLAFKSAVTADPLRMLATWKPGNNCCTWSGVNCRLNARVTELSIYGDPDNPNSFLSATIPLSLSNLRHLSGLYLMDLKNLTGPFPAALFRLPNLAYVYIKNARLSGPLPSDIGRRLPNLGALGLSGNRFSGLIPSSLTQMTHLIQLDLSNNALVGEIPTGLRNLENLTLLSLDSNSFGGAIPDLSPLTQLRYLTVSHNRLTGNIPSSLAALAPQLVKLSLANNLLTGSIPYYLGDFTHLDTLDLSGNYFTGAVPSNFRNLTKIFNLNLSSNSLVDPFPAMAVKGIESLDLSNNKLHLGKIPNWVVSSPIIYSLNLAGCGIKMRLEDFKPAETYYYDYIDLSDNEISGNPAGLLNRTGKLLGFRAAGNKMRFDMGKLKLPATLQGLDISRNSVYGKVPAEVAGLKELNVSYNHLCGPIPPTKFPASAFAGNDCLCGPPLRRCRRGV